MNFLLINFFLISLLLVTTFFIFKTTSLISVVALTGVVVNYALVFIDFANKRKWAGASLYDAVRSAGIQRFRQP